VVFFKKKEKMKKATSLVFLLAISLCLPISSFARAEKEEATKEFQELKADFEDEISNPPYSDYTFTDRYWDSESGRKIIAIGTRALPFIMEEIENGKSWFTVAAQRITGIKMRGSTAQELNEQWLDWWEENRDNPEWNAFYDSGVPENNNNSGY